jgi:hypothetical protein
MKIITDFTFIALYATQLGIIFVACLTLWHSFMLQGLPVLFILCHFKVLTTQALTESFFVF